MSIIHFYRRPALTRQQEERLLDHLLASRLPVRELSTEFCFNVQVSAGLTDNEMNVLKWLLAETFEPQNFSNHSFFDTADTDENYSVLEVGPRMNFTTAWSTNAVSVCHSCGLTGIERVERSRRYRFILDKDIFTSSGEAFIPSLISRHGALFFDRMTECTYPEPIRSFEPGFSPAPVFEVKLIEEGKAALEKINREMGLGFDEWDIDYYYNLFVNDIGRNPTNVECFDLSQSNSEHSRHWFFKGRLLIDGEEADATLIDLIKRPLENNPSNSIIAFKDNSSAIRGYRCRTIIPEKTPNASRFRESEILYHPIFTAETHNFPSGVAPFPGAETGTGGRIRDVEATGRGGLVIAGTAAYCVGNLRIPGYDLPWEEAAFEYPPNLASPLEIEIQASNGASDYGNKFGEPLIQGFTRSFGLRLPNGERYEWIKPIMFTGGVGQMDARHTEKGAPEKGMLVVKIGGPAYRIGIGGGAASSMIQGENVEELDFNAVQRGDAEMEQKLNRVLRACIEMGDANPIVSIHDQGAGGNCNVLKELIYPAGAKIEIRRVNVGDSTLSVLEIWGAEYQENNALLIRNEDIGMFESLCRREKVPHAVVGTITGDGRIVLYDEHDGSMPEDLELEKILGDMPQKIFRLDRSRPDVRPLALPDDVAVNDVLQRVLRLVSVGSKRFLTNKVDRSVTGLIARQQCCGPLHLTVADVAVVAQSHFGLTGTAISIGEQPLKTLLDPSAMARLCVGEALTNMVWARVSALEDIKCSGNWMWAAKLPGEGAKLYDAAVALSDVMTRLGIAIDGGKDSLSMAAQVRTQNTDNRAQTVEIVKSPGTLVISAYATCPDITKVITPDLKRPGESRLLYIDLGGARNRLGGSALAHVFNQIGDESPDLEDPELLKRAFNVIQTFIDRGLVLSGHDRSDGGLIVTLLEMAFSGDCGLEIELKVGNQETVEEIMRVLFAEELGLVMEYLPEHESAISDILDSNEIPHQIIGNSLREKRIKIGFREPDSPDTHAVLDEDMRVLRDIWEETSYQIERLQADPDCAEQEKKAIYDRKGPAYAVTFDPDTAVKNSAGNIDRPKVAIIREEGSNSDREMASAFFMAGFEPWDVTMTDLLAGSISLDMFRGMAFVGGFSYADVLDSAKGWAGVIRFNDRLWDEFTRFYNRRDTFSLGVCNGCQLMALLGWVPFPGNDDKIQPRFIHNISGRFESRFSTVKIFESPSIMLNGMEGSVLGVWVAHGEGRAYFPDAGILDEVEKERLAPVRYVDDGGEVTNLYPFNPNGSEAGIAALCSPEGRHLAIMPHPERTFLKWQWPWMSEEWKKNLGASPWLKMFQNARRWCEENE